MIGFIRNIFRKTPPTLPTTIYSWVNMKEMEDSFMAVPYHEKTEAEVILGKSLDSWRRYHDRPR